MKQILSLVLLTTLGFTLVDNVRRVHVDAQPLKVSQVKIEPIKQSLTEPKVMAASANIPAPPPVAAPAVASGGDIQGIIVAAANKYGIDPQRALRIAKCESGFNTSVQNTSYYAGGGHPTGLFQYLPETWTRIAGRSPHGVGDIYSAHDQANVTMWAWANGYAGEWECS